MLPFPSWNYDGFYFELYFSDLCDLHRARFERRLAFKVFPVWFNSWNVHYWEDLHWSQKSQFKCIISDVLGDVIGSKPSFHELLRCSGKFKVLGGEPNFVTNLIIWCLGSVSVCMTLHTCLCLFYVLFRLFQSFFHLLCQFLSCWCLCSLLLKAHFWLVWSCDYKWWFLCTQLFLGVIGELCER